MKRAAALLLAALIALPASAHDVHLPLLSSMLLLLLVALFVVFIPWVRSLRARIGTASAMLVTHCVMQPGVEDFARRSPLAGVAILLAVPLTVAFLIGRALRRRRTGVRA